VDSFSYKGKYYSFDNVKLTPKPYQKPWPEIRKRRQQRRQPSRRSPSSAHGVFRRGAARHAGGAGGPTSRPIARRWKEAGHPGEGKVFLRAPVYIAETDEGGT